MMLEEYDYDFTFEHIGEQYKESGLRIFDYRANRVIDVQIMVDDSQIPLLNYQALAPQHSDLVDIAIAVHLVDRLATNYSKMVRTEKEMPRRIRIRLPLQTYRKLNDTSIPEKLREVLYWFTGDFWTFEFLPYTKHPRTAQRQHPLPFLSQTNEATRVALWSGGLDAFAGAYQQLCQDNASNYILFGTGSNNYMNATQRETSEMLVGLFPGRIQLLQLPFALRGVNDDIRTSSSMRSRGFVFLLLGAVCAHHIEKNTLHIHENGVGAINLPFRKSEVALDHSRSVHPLSLVYMSDLLSTILGQPFLFRNPFLSWTKAQMCKELLTQGFTKLASFTVSCDSRHRAYLQQCGYCSSCLLRRQAIVVSGVPDKTSYQITDNSKRKRNPKDALYYRAMLAQVNTMKTLLATSDSWQRMSQHYLTLSDIVENMGVQREQEVSQTVLQTRLLQLYREYVNEWEQVREPLGRAFLE